MRRHSDASCPPANCEALRGSAKFVTRLCCTPPYPLPPELADLPRTYLRSFPLLPSSLRLCFVLRHGATSALLPYTHTHTRNETTVFSPSLFQTLLLCLVSLGPLLCLVSLGPTEDVDVCSRTRPECWTPGNQDISELLVRTL